MQAGCYPVETLRRFTTTMFVAGGLTPEGAATVADVLVHADLRGHASHGITRIPIGLKRLKAGVVKARPEVTVTRLAPALAMVDADNGPGPIASVRAVDEAVAMAASQGVACAVVRHSNHNGAGSYYAERAMARGCLAFAFTNAPPSMAVHGGRTPAVGTNPVTIGVPAGPDSLLLDMATSVVARGKIVEAAKRGERIPEGWALDRDGRPTTDARVAEAGVILPLAGAKGSALAIMVEVLTGVMAGGRFAEEMGNLYRDFDTPQDTAHCFFALQVDKLHPGGGFAPRVARLVQSLKRGPAAEGAAEILMPGEPEARRRTAAERDGVRLPANVIADLDAAADAYGVARLGAAS